MRAAFTLPFEDGLNIEREQFTRLVQGEQSQALRHIFFGEREAQRIPDLPADSKGLTVNKLVVIGGGTMGGGIAMSAANNGLPVTMSKPRGGAAEGPGTLRGELAAQRRLRPDGPSEYEKRRALLTGTTDFDGGGRGRSRDRGGLREHGGEEGDFCKLDKAARPGACSPRTPRRVDRRDRLRHQATRVGRRHAFLQPGQRHAAVGECAGGKSNPTAIATATEVGKRIGKLPVLVGNCDGFVGNRMTGNAARRSRSCCWKAACRRISTGS